MPRCRTEEQRREARTVLQRDIATLEASLWRRGPDTLAVEPYVDRIRRRWEVSRVCEGSDTLWYVQKDLATADACALFADAAQQHDGADAPTSLYSCVLNDDLLLCENCVVKHSTLDRMAACGDAMRAVLDVLDNMPGDRCWYAALDDVVCCVCQQQQALTTEDVTHTRMYRRWSPYSPGSALVLCQQCYTTPCTACGAAATGHGSNRMGPRVHIREVGDFRAAAMYCVQCSPTAVVSQSRDLRVLVC